MIFVKTFKGYEDKTAQLDALVNEWIATNTVSVKAIAATLSHEYEGRAGSGDLVYTVSYEAERPFS